MSFNCADNERYNDALVALAEGKYDVLSAAYAGTDVGFGPGHEAVLASLSSEFAGYLRDLGPWFDYLGRFRHALEHHVPLYVSADTVSQAALREFAEKGERIGDTERRRDHAEADRLTRERSALVSFFPIVECAFAENANKGAFQFQMMGDLETVAEIAQRLLLEFD